MPTTLIVTAHPEPNSFTNAWARASAKACEELGHKVLWSDLYEMEFDPVERAANFKNHEPSDHFDILKAQDIASEQNNFADDVAAEQDKVRQADRIIFHYPIWWFKEPAILKGWCDRVLASSEMHTVDERYDHGRFKFTRALFCVNTGANAYECAPDGKEGDLEMLLWPMAHTLRYLGMTTMKPVCAHGVHSYHQGATKIDLEQRLAKIIDDQINVLRDFDNRDIIKFNADDDFDDNGSLKPGAKSYSAFVRHGEDH
jgi:NAD(P)H dehydrogenase (quinone)